MSRSCRKAFPKRGPASITTCATSRNTSKARMRAGHTCALSETERAQHARAFVCALLHKCPPHQFGFTQRSCVCTFCHLCFGLSSDEQSSDFALQTPLSARTLSTHEGLSSKMTSIMSPFAMLWSQAYCFWGSQLAELCRAAEGTN